MAHYTVLDAPQLADALAHFGLPSPSRFEPEPRGAVNTGYHVWSGDHRYFLRVNETGAGAESAVRFEAEVHRYLQPAQFPVPELFLAKDGRPFAEVAGKPAMLFAYAPGEVLALEAVSPERCRRLGEQLARLHELAAGFGSSRPNPFGPAWVAARLEAAIAARAGGEEAALALPLLRDELALAAALPGAPRGLIHGDLFVDNVLWIGDRVSALLDWEMSCVEPFAYDLGVAVNAWCYTDRFLPDRCRALLAGYRSRRKVEQETLAGLHRWSRFAALRFAVGRLAGYVPAGLPAAEGTRARKDWRRYRDRLTALREAGEDGHRELLGL
jgi:homoserine kinase type II